MAQGVRAFPLGPSHQLVKGWSHSWSPPSFGVLGWTSPARAGWTGPVPFKFFTGSAGTLRGEEKRLQLDSSPHIKGSRDPGLPSGSGPWAQSDPFVPVPVT